MQPLLIAGASGTLGHAFTRACLERYLAHVTTTRAVLDLGDAPAVSATLDRIRPWLVINATGYVRVDDAEGDAVRCRRENELAPIALAHACAVRGIPLMTFSSDLVFDGAKSTPYTEADAASPLGVYGSSKFAGEGGVLAAHPGALVVRTSAFFGPWDRYNFAVATLRTLRAERSVAAANDTFVSPTYVPDLVHTALDLAIDGATGLWHLASAGVTSWSQFAIDVARGAGYPAPAIVGTESVAMRWRAARPRFSALTSNRGVLLPPLADALRRFELARDKELD